jgi:hypothetical protein
MSNPDNEVHTSTLGLFGSSIPVALLYWLFLIALFSYKDSMSYFNIYLWLLFPIFAYLMGAVMNIINQYITCKTIHAGKAFLGAVPLLGSVLISMGIGSISYCRIPPTSAFAPLFYSQSMDVLPNDNNKSNIKSKVHKYCCPQKSTLEHIEKTFPMIKGISMGFYVLFGVLFGNVIGSGLSSIC